MAPFWSWLYFCATSIDLFTKQWSLSNLIAGGNDSNLDTVRPDSQATLLLTERNLIQANSLLSWQDEPLRVLMELGLPTPNKPLSDDNTSHMCCNVLALVNHAIKSEVSCVLVRVRSVPP